MFGGGIFIMKEIQLTKGQVALVDDEDYDYLKQWHWFARIYSRWSSYYAFRGFYFSTNGKTKNIHTNIPMHREIIKAPRHLVVDHIDHNGLNNQKSNLRLCTIAQNNANRFSLKNSTSIYLGVYFAKDRNKWRAAISVNDKILERKSFDTEIEAALYYNELAIKYHGEFANLNIIENEHNGE